MDYEFLFIRNDEGVVYFNMLLSEKKTLR